MQAFSGQADASTAQATKVCKSISFLWRKQRSSFNSSKNNAFDVEKIQATEESMLRGRSANPPLLISLRGWLQTEQIVSFVATWMAGKAFNQNHLQREVQPVPGCHSTEQVSVMT